MNTHSTPTLAAVAPATTCSGFFIVNDHDRPWEASLAERREDGKFYYVHPTLRDDKRYHGITPEKPTPVESFGLMVDVKAGALIGLMDDTASVVATYRDGRPRRWQGSRVFSFDFQNASGDARRDGSPLPSQP